MDRRHALALPEDPATGAEGLAWFEQRLAALAALLAGAAAVDPYGSRTGFRRTIETCADQFRPR